MAALTPEVSHIWDITVNETRGVFTLSLEGSGALGFGSPPVTRHCSLP